MVPNKGGCCMNLVLSDKLKQYLGKKNTRILTVDQVDLKNCWLAPNLPSVMESLPKEPEKFNKQEVDGITIYLNKSIKFNRETVKLDIRKYLFTKEIFIEGVDITY